LALWRTLWQQAARHRYWMKGAAIAYGIALSLLLGALTLVAIVALRPALQAPFVAQIAVWFPDWSGPVNGLFNGVIAEWSPIQRWLLLIVGATTGTALWLKVTGLTQQIIRSDGDLASHLVPTVRHRLMTVLVAIASASLTLLAIGLVLMSLPGQPPGAAIAAPSLWHFTQRMVVQILRWGLASSTVALVFGVLYRSSQKSSAKALPILPGTLFATMLWLFTCVFFKWHLATLAEQHWLWSVCSTLTLTLMGLYLSTLGLLLGGQYNKLIHRYYPVSRSRKVVPAAPPPSFESFTIQKRHYR
jgi:membrane protein